MWRVAKRLSETYKFIQSREICHGMRCVIVKTFSSSDLDLFYIDRNTKSPYQLLVSVIGIESIRGHLIKGLGWYLVDYKCRPGRRHRRCRAMAITKSVVAARRNFSTVALISEAASLNQIYIIYIFFRWFKNYTVKHIKKELISNKQIPIHTNIYFVGF